MDVPMPRSCASTLAPPTSAPPLPQPPPLGLDEEEDAALTPTAGWPPRSRQGTDQLLVDIAEYVVGFKGVSKEAIKTARYAISDAVGCGILALNSPECCKLVGPLVPGVRVENGCHVPGTDFCLDPMQAAFSISTMNRWLDYNDTWLAAEWSHPSDCLGGVLAVAEHVSRVRVARGLPSLMMQDVILSLIKAYEIQGLLSLENSMNQIGVDHSLFLRVACAAVATHLLGGGRREVVNAVSHAFVDGAGLRSFRHYPNVGSRKGWAAGDTAARAVFLALLTMKGEMGQDLVLSAPVWGFNDVFFRRAELALKRDFGSYIMENVLFKAQFPVEYHAVTAVEAALRLHPQVVHRLDEIHSISISSTRSCIRCIDKTGPLRNFADRDHCLQYAVAIALLYGTLTQEHYSDAVAQDPRIDAVRKKMNVLENPQYSADYMDPDKRSITNAVQVHFQDRTSTPKVEVEFPVGHRRRRLECFPTLEKKLLRNLLTKFSANHAGRIFEVCTDPQMLDITTVVDFMDLLRLPTVPYVLPPMRSLRLEPLGLADKENTSGAEEEDGAAKLGDALLGLTPR